MALKLVVVKITVILSIFQHGQACVPPRPASNPTTVPSPTHQTASSPTTEETPYEWPCSNFNNQTSKIGSGSDAAAGSFPFYVAIQDENGDFKAGVLVSSWFVLTQIQVRAVKVAYGIQTGQSIEEIFQNSPNQVKVAERIEITSNPELILLHLTTPIPPGPLTKPIQISDCSGPSNAAVGDTLAYYGLGFDNSNHYADTMQVNCGKVVDPTQICQNYETNFGMEESICLVSNTCYYDWGGPIVTIDEESNQLFLAGIIYLVSSCSSINPQ